MKKRFYFYAVVLLFAWSANAQEPSLIGLWQKKGEVFILEIQQTGGQTKGTVIRADWEPLLAGSILISHLQYDANKNRWSASIYDGATSTRQGTVKLKRNTLSIKAKGRKKTVWIRTDSKDFLNAGS